MTPNISIVVCCYNMARELPRTIRSLSPPMQRGVRASDYEIIIVDNGSTERFDVDECRRWFPNLRVIRTEPQSAQPSPVGAINAAIAQARGALIGVMIDGARIASPGIIAWATKAARLADRAVILTLSFHLGLQVQMESVLKGYNQEEEDRLLDQSGWTLDGYRLFDISVFAGSSAGGWFAPMRESNAIFMRKALWEELGGLDEQFQMPGGGYVNPDTLSRAIELPGATIVTLLGEGTFHQVHGGVATNATRDVHEEFHAEYIKIRGGPYEPPVYQSVYVGSAPGCEPALGRSFDRALWALSPLPPPSDAAIAALVDLAETEFRAGRFEAAATVARMARIHAPNEPAPQRLLVHASSWLHGNAPPDDRRANFHLVRAQAYRLLGDAATAAAEFRTALTFDADLVSAHVGLSELEMPGEGYVGRLARFHAALSPETYLEIGVGRGQTLACARPPTRAIGIDPEPKINVTFKAETHIFCEKSDAFFARQGLVPLLNSRPLTLAFIDGLHVFQQSLRDFMYVEAFCGPQSAVLFHDTVPLDEVTQRPDRQRSFYTGDVWKTILCLKHYRPDLDIFTIPTPWTGLTVVTNLDPASRILPDRYDEAVARFIETPYSEIENNKHTMLNMIPNEWSVVESRLKARGLSVTLRE